VNATAKTLLEAERFFAHVDKGESSDGCWIWKSGRKGGRTGQEYGSFHTGSRKKGGGRGNRLAHRWSYEHTYGPIERGKVIHHKCENKMCVNPEHLQQVTVSYNRSAYATQDR